MKLRVAVLITVFAVFMVFLSSPVSAAPPCPGKLAMQQPSGEKVVVTLHGDEYFHWYETEDGTVLLLDGDGWLRYAQYSEGSLSALEARYGLDGRPAGALLGSDLGSALAANPPQAARAPALAAAAQHVGSIPAPQAPEPLLVILVSFTDADIPLRQTDAYWSGKMFADYHTYAEKTDARSSVNDYYKEVSGGKFWFSKAAETSGTANDGVIRVSLDIAHPAYPDDDAQFKANSNNVTIRALAKANPTIDFAAFDKDHSGVLTPDELHIVIILAGYEQSIGDVYKAVWAHSYSLPDNGNKGIPLDGVFVGCDYTQQGEIQTDHPATIGVLAHELGHSLGLPDLYDYDDYGHDSQGVGPYSLMAGGSWEFNIGSFPGSSPTHLDAWSKCVLGFVTPGTFASGSHTLSAIATGNYNVVRVPTTDPKQYFLLENRQNNFGYDKPLSAYFQTGGVAVWHIDEQVLDNSVGWQYVNNDQNHKAVDLEEADQGILGYAQLDLSDQDPRSWPPYNHLFRTGDAACNSALNAGTTPSSRLYNGSDSGVRIAVSSPGGNVMTANVGLYVSSLTPGKASPLLQYRTVRWTAAAQGAANITYKFDVYRGQERVGGTDGYSAVNWLDWTPTAAADYAVEVSALGDGVGEPVKRRVTYTVAADTVPPAITATAGGVSLAPGGSTRGDSVTAAATDPAGGVVTSRSYTFAGGAPVDSWPTFTAEGSYVLSATDQAGNTATFSFSIDRTAPVVQATAGGSPQASGAIMAQSVAIAISDLHPGAKSATQNGAAFAWPADNVFSLDGAYAVTAADVAGNKTTFSFTVDKTAPVIGAMAGSAAVGAGQVKSAAITVTVTELHPAACTATHDGEAYAWPAGGVFSQDGTYIIDTTDAAGNASSFTFTVDRTAPAIAATAGGVTLEQGRTSGTAVTVQVTDAHLDGAKVKALKNGAAYAWPADGLFAEPGVYTVTAADLAGNMATFRFGVLVNAGKLAVHTAAGYVLDGDCVGADVTVELTDEAWSATISCNGTLVGSWGPSDKGAHTFTQEGRYAVTCTDGAGSATLRFTLDKSNPIIAARNASGGVVSAGSLNKTAVTVAATDLSAVTLAAKRNGAAWAWPAGGKFTAEGSYTVMATDAVGHASSFSFAIDLAAPVISAQPATGGKVANKGYSRANTRVIISDMALASKSVKKDGKAFSWPSGGVFTAEGVYAITAADKFGRASTFTFTLDKTLPTVKARLSTGRTAASGGYYRYSVTVTVSDKNLSGKSATKYGKAMAWPARSKFTAPGSYRITAYDRAGNSRVFTFVIDTTKPVITAKTLSGATVRSGGSATGGVVVTVSESYLASKTVKLGTKTIAWPSSNKFTAKGTYTLTVKDKAGNSKTFKFRVK